MQNIHKANKLTNIYIYIRTEPSNVHFETHAVPITAVRTSGWSFGANR